MGLTERNGRRQPIRWIVEGSEPRALAFLKALSAMGCEDRATAPGLAQGDEC
jgi:hypothetical protein